MSQKSEVAIEGMDCASCAAGIERALRRLGLPDASVNFATSSAYFTTSESMPPEKVAAEINRLGYSARVRTDEPTQNHDSHHHGGELSLGLRALISAVLSLPLLMHMVLPWHLLHNGWFQLTLTVPVVILGAMQFGRSALASIRAGLPNMDVLIITGVGAAFFYSTAGLMLGLGEDYLFFETAATIVTLVFIGNYFEHRSVKKAASAIEELSRAQVTTAKRVSFTDGRETTTEIRASEVIRGDRLRINTGDRVPADGEIESGEILADESILTGESLPLHRAKGMNVIGGSAVQSGSAVMIASEVGENSVLGGIVRLVREAQGDKPSIQRMGDIVAAYFTPVAISIALITFLAWYVFLDLSFRDALLRSVAVLVIACPCAMGLATPTAIMVGIGRAARHGILFRGGAALERLSKVGTVVFDKTGTLTTGEFRVGKIELVQGEENFARSVILGLEQHSSHPIARSLVREIGPSVTPLPFSSVEERKGFGMIGKSDDQTTYSLGTSADLNVSSSEPRDGKLVLAKNGAVLARIEVADSIKPGAVEVIRRLKALNIATVLLSGDSREKCEAVATSLGIDTVHSEKTPEQKLSIVADLQTRGLTAFVGDGVNDAPALAAAGVGIAMSNGTHLAIESSDVVLLQGSIDRLFESIALSRATVVTIKQNLFWAFSYNVIAIPVAALGFLNPMVAAFAMGFSDVMTIGNSLRLRTKTLKDS